MKKAKHIVKHRQQKYRSNFERDTALSLKREGVDFEYETMRIKYKRLSVYTPDFIFGNGVIIEAKGYMPPKDRTKHILIKQQHPSLDIRFLFQNAYNTLTKNSNTTYADWCDRYGFLWCHKRIPSEWTITVS
jgi:hypothetical protein